MARHLKDHNAPSTVLIPSADCEVVCPAGSCGATVRYLPGRGKQFGTCPGCNNGILILTDVVPEPNTKLTDVIQLTRKS